MLVFCLRKARRRDRTVGKRMGIVGRHVRDAWLCAVHRRSCGRLKVDEVERLRAPNKGVHGLVDTGYKVRPMVRRHDGDVARDGAC